MWCAARARVYRECWFFGQTRAQAAGTSVSSNAWPDGRFISRGDTRIKLYTLATMFPRGFGALEFSSIDHTMHASQPRSKSYSGCYSAKTTCLVTIIQGRKASGSRCPRRVALTTTCATIYGVLHHPGMPLVRSTSFSGDVGDW